MTLAEAHNWTPEQIDRMDPVFIAELFAQKRAHADHATEDASLTPEQRKKKTERQTIQRKIEIMKRREQSGSK